MVIQFRSYLGLEDYQRIDEFLIQHYQFGNLDGNWLEPAWEYMHFHPQLDNTALGKIGIWEDDDHIAAVVHYESRLGEAFFQFHPNTKYLRGEMLDYAENSLRGRSHKDDKYYLGVYVNDFDTEMQMLVKERGYEIYRDNTRPMYQFEIPEPFPNVTLPEGFRLTSLAEDCDWAKVNRVIWRGFNHPGELPSGEDEVESRRRMFDTPSARRGLKIIVTAPNGDYAALCGMFYEPVNHYAYVEPVATDPTYRRMGLGKAAVLEGIRRCAASGAAVAYVGSDQDFYQAIGFRKSYLSECWLKYWDS